MVLKEKRGVSFISVILCHSYWWSVKRSLISPSSMTIVAAKLFWQCRCSYIKHNTIVPYEFALLHHGKDIVVLPNYILGPACNEPTHKLHVL